MPVRFDAQAAARLERIYASPEIVEQRARTRAALRVRPGERGLDIGCGPGFLSCELAREVGPTGRVASIDASPEMLEAARARAAREGLADRIEVASGDAARLDFPGGAFDFVVAVQVYLYVAEIEQALGEAARVLRPGGRLVVVDTDWDSCVWLTADRARHPRVMEAHAGRFVQARLPPRLARLLRGAGLVPAEVAVIPVLNLRYDADSFSGGIIGSTREAAIKHGLPREEAEAWEAALRGRTADGDYFFSVN